VYVRASNALKTAKEKIIFVRYASLLSGEEKLILIARVAIARNSKNCQ
jgi:hypothetical protein